MIGSALKRLFSQPPLEQHAHEAYMALVEQARHAWFYEKQGVPDTVDGRFDVMVLHMFLLVHRLRKETSETAAHFIRAISEVFFADMDRSLREMGAGDTGVGIRVRKMVEAFYGRLQAYEQGLADPQSLAASLKRNLFRGAETSDQQLKALQDYMLRSIAHLEGQDATDILEGRLSFTPIR